MPIVRADAPMYLAASIGCLRSLVELHGLPPNLRTEFEKHMHALERLHGQMGLVRTRKFEVRALAGRGTL